MSTTDILNMTESHLIYEEFIKAICEPKVISIVKVLNELLNIEMPNYHLISRGGDALNYYYGMPNFVPTHDWDLGIVRVPSIDNLDQRTYIQLMQFADNCGNTLATNLNNFIPNDVNNRITVQIGGKESPLYDKIQFQYTRVSARLSVIVFSYTDPLTGFQRQNSMIDIYIMGNFAFDVKDAYNLAFDTIIPHFEPKYDVKKLSQLLAYFQNDRNLLINYLQTEASTKKTLFKNTFNYIVQDPISSMKYVAPGDLLNDTMRMIYQSFYNIGISPGNNKVDKYIMKYSKLLDVINKMIDLCPDNSCIAISAEILSRNTNLNNCEGIRIANRDIWEGPMRVFLSKWYNQQYILNGDWNLVPSQKLCQMYAILDYVVKKWKIT